MADGLGFEPRQAAPEAAVLPLHYPSVYYIYKNTLCYINTKVRISPPSIYIEPGRGPAPSLKTFVAGEPRQAAPEAAVLPLHYPSAID